MSGHFRTEQVSTLTGVPVPTLCFYASRGILRPAVYGTRQVGHQWSIVQALAISCGQILRGMGLHGESIHGAIKFIAAYSERDLAHVLQSRSVLSLYDGVSQLVTPDFVRRRMDDNLAGAGACVPAIDVARAWRRLEDRIAELEANGWPREPVAEEVAVE